MWKAICLIAVSLLTLTLADSPSPPPTYACDEFDKYTEDWGKVYDEREKDERRKIFFENCMAVNKHNSKPGPAHFKAVNEYTDMTQT
jgi:hypothetical protein